MKRSPLYYILLIILRLHDFTQNSDNISSITPVSRGKLILINGKIINFNQLTSEGDSLSLMNANDVFMRFNKNDIYLISKTRNCLMEGMLSGCIGGLLGSVSGTTDWNNTPELKEKGQPL